MSASVSSTIEGVTDRRQSLTDRLGDIEKRLEAYARWKAHTNGRIEELEAETTELRDRPDGIGARLDGVESGDTGKKEASTDSAEPPSSTSGEDASRAG